MKCFLQRAGSSAWGAVDGLLLLTAGCVGRSSTDTSSANNGADGPAGSEAATAHQVGNVASGREVFRFETFGNEGFWTDAVRLQQGMVAAKVTPIMALKLGLSVDIEALDAATQRALAAELKTDLSPKNAPMLNDPATTAKLVNANAVIGIVAKDTNGDGVVDITKGDKSGASCALCHTITDASVYNMPNGGSIGKRLDGRAVPNSNLGTIFATPVINQPQIAILGVGAVEKTPVVIDDMIAIRSIAHIALTFDHRLIDGALADQFCQKVKAVLENWQGDVL